MKVSIASEEIEIQFPCLMQHEKTGAIILATGYHTKTKENYKGVCLYSGNSTTLSQGEEKYFNVPAWRQWNGLITLKN